MSTAWAKHLINQGKYSKILDDGKTGILEWEAQGTNRIFFHMENTKIFLIHPDAITEVQDFHLVNFFYNSDTTRMVRSFVCSIADGEGIQPNSFLRLIRVSRDPRKPEIKDAFAFKTINGAEAESPYSSASFFSADVDRNIGNIHKETSPLYPLIQEFLGERESCLLPLTDSSSDPLDMYALELEVASILSRQSQQTEETAQASLPLDQPERVEVLECEVSLPMAAPAEAEPNFSRIPKRKKEKPSRALKAFHDSLCPPSETLLETREMQRKIEAEIFKRAIAEQVQREQGKVRARVERELQREQNIGRGSRAKKGTQSHERPEPPTQSSASPAINFEQMQRDVEADLLKRRVHYREMARLVAGVIQELPPEQLSIMSENVRGSHSILHLEGGAATATLVRPHGSTDLTIPGYRARSIASSVIEMLRRAFQSADFARR